MHNRNQNFDYDAFMKKVTNSRSEAIAERLEKIESLHEKMLDGTISNEFEQSFVSSMHELSQLVDEFNIKGGDLRTISPKRASIIDSLYEKYFKAPCSRPALP